jgi:uncharacterized protein YdaU (DUF1376 family)
MANLRALFWWIDRWRKSTAYTDMTLEEQGAYRNLLDEQTLRGGFVPNDERIMAKACGDALAWPRVRDAVLARFDLSAAGWQNPTLEGVNKASTTRAERQKRYRDRNAARNAGRNAPHNGKAKAPAKGSSVFRGQALYVSEKMHGIIVQSLGKRAEGIEWLAVYQAADADFARDGEPAELLRELKRRARLAADARRDLLSGPPGIEESAALLASWRQKDGPQ